MIRPLHVLILTVLVVGVIGFTAKVMTSTSSAGGNSASSSAAAIQPPTSGASSTPTTTGTSIQTVAKTTSDLRLPSLAPLVVAQPAPTYMDGALAPSNQPSLTSAAWVALDVSSNQIVLAGNETDRRAIASLTKMMTALLAAEAENLVHLVTVSSVAAGVEPNKDGLIIGNRYPRGVLLYSALLGSNNDAAAALGEDLGGTYGSFYKLMNKRARQLGMTNTRYASSSGLNDNTNYSTARDQAIMLARALENPIFAKATGTWKHTVRWADTGGTRTYTNHNKMLQTYRGTIGGKTGYTTIAGNSLAVAVKRGGRTMIGVILDSNDLWGDMPRLMDAAFKRTS